MLDIQPEDFFELIDCKFDDLEKLRQKVGRLVHAHTCKLSDKTKIGGVLVFPSVKGVEWERIKSSVMTLTDVPNILKVRLDDSN